MGILLGTYNDLVKEAEEAAKNAELQERIEFLNKYASLATELMAAEFPNDYTKDDVVALADRLIERDLAITDQQEKTAEAVETIGEYVKVARELLEKENGKDFTETTVEKLASTLYELDAVDEFCKEASVIAEVAFVDGVNKLAEAEFESIDEIEEALKTAGMMDAMKPAMAATKKFVTESAGSVADKAKYLYRKNPVATVAGAAGLTGLAAGVTVGRASGGDR